MRKGKKLENRGGILYNKINIFFGGSAMKKRFLAVVLTVAVIIGMIPLGIFSAAAATAEDGIMYITHLRDLELLEELVNEDGLDTTDLTCIVTSDIGTTSHSGIDWDSKFTGSIGTVNNPFKGKFIGNGHTVWLDSAEGLFGAVENAEINGVVTAGRVVSLSEAGGIARVAYDSTIKDCTNRADISVGHCGGIVCRAYGTEIIGCVNRGSVTATATDAGGIAFLVEENDDGVISEILSCLNSGDVLAKQNAAGIAVYFSKSNILNSASVGNIVAGFENENQCTASGCIVSAHDPYEMKNIFTDGTIAAYLEGTTASVLAEKQGSATFTVENVYTSITDCDAGSDIPATTVETLEDAVTSLNGLTRLFSDTNWYRWRIKTFADKEAELRIVRPLDGAGTEDDPYRIDNIDQFELFADCVNAGNSFEGKYFTLTANIGSEEDSVTELVGYYIESIGIDYPDNLFFCGVFDGGGHTVYYDIDRMGKEHRIYALFSGIKNATVKNLLTDGSIEITGKNSGDDGGISAGIVGYAENSTILDCTNNARVCGYGEVSIATGIVYSCDSSQIIGCINTGEICSENYAAGIVLSFGCMNESDDTYQIKNCINHGDITVNSALNSAFGSFAAGIVCNMVFPYANAEISNCANCGKITATCLAGSFAAGIFYSSITDKSEISVNNCFVGGEMNAPFKGLVEISSYGNTSITNIATTLEGVYVNCSDETSGTGTKVDDLYAAAELLNTEAKKHDDWYQWVIRNDILCFNTCKHENITIKYDWNGTYTECVAKAVCDDCGDTIATETANETTGYLNFFVDTLGNCQTHAKGHFEAAFQTEPFETQNAPENSAQSEYFGYHVDNDRDGVCDLCKSEGIIKDGGLIQSEDGRFLFEITDASKKTLSLISDTTVYIMEDEEIFISPYEYSNLKTNYYGNITVPEKVYYAGNYYTVTGIGGALPWDAYKAPFAGKTKLTGVSLPDTVEYIGTFSFDDCASLAELVIPAKVKHIGEAVFGGCDNIESLIFKSATPPELSEEGFIPDPLGHMGSLQTIYVPEDSVEEYKEAFSGYKDIIKPISEKQYFPGIAPDCESYGQLEYYKYDGKYYKDKDHTEIIGENGTEAELAVWLYTPTEQGGGLVKNLGHTGVCCEHITDGHLCTRNGCYKADKKIPIDHFDSDSNGRCDECGTVCAEVCSHDTACSNFYAYYAEFEDDGKPLTQDWYYIDKNTDAEKTVMIAGENVGFIIANGVTFKADYYLMDGASIDVYYQSHDDKVKGEFDGRECLCYNSETGIIRPEHYDGNSDGVCDNCGKASIEYIDENGEEAFMAGVEKFTSYTTTLSSGWYYVEGSKSIYSPLVIDGDVHIILVDGSYLGVQYGIIVPEGKSLSVYGQKVVNKLGTLDAKCSYHSLRGMAGIGGSFDSYNAGNITINGGYVEAYGGAGAAGIGGGYGGNGGTVTINGGTVIAKGGTGAAGIGGGFSGNGIKCIINGGTITATAGIGNNSVKEAAGIGGGYAGECGEIEINSVESLVSNGGKAFGAGLFAESGKLNIKVDAGLIIKSNGIETDVINDQPEIEITKAYKGVSLTLSSDISINFYVNLTETEAKSGSMKFTVGGRTFTADCGTNASGTYFRCPLTSLEMAETVKAEFTLNGITYKKEYSVTEYVEKILSGNYGEEMETLAEKIANYGYYAQILLAKIHSGVTVGEGGYVEMIHYDSLDVEAAKTGLSAYGYSRNYANADILSVSRSLYLDDKTAMNFYIEVAEGCTLSKSDISVSEGKEFKLTKSGTNEYLITVADIEAVNLGVNYKIKVGDEVITASALSYANTIVNGEFSAESQNAMAALYEYYLAAVNYAK